MLKECMNEPLNSQMRAGKTIHQETTEYGSDNGRKLFSVIYHAYTEEKLRLPTQPQTAFEIRELIRADADLNDISLCAQRDPGLAVRLVKVANSPLYRGVENVRTLPEAIGRIGLNATRNIAYVLSVQNLFNAKSAIVNEQMKYAYARSCEMAASGFILASRTASVAPDTALLAGLVSHIGLLPILYYIDQHSDLVNSHLSLDGSLKKLRGIVGTMVLRQWDFNDELIAVPENCEYWGRETDNQQIDCCDTVILSNLLLQLQSGDRESADIESLPVFKRMRSGKNGQAVCEQISSGDIFADIKEAALMLS